MPRGIYDRKKAAEKPAEPSNIHEEGAQPAFQPIQYVAPTNEIETLKNAIRMLESRVVELEQIKNPVTIEGKVNNLFEEVERMTNEILKLNAAVKGLTGDKADNKAS